MNKIALMVTVVGMMAGSVFSEPMKVTLTFDDGTPGHIRLAAPAIEKNGWRGTFNIITSAVGDGSHLTWDEVRDLQRRGHEIASHTVSHPNLRALWSAGKTNEVERQLREARDTLTRELGKTPRFMCLPYSQTTPGVNELSRSLGQEPMVLERFNVGNNVTPEGFAKQLDAWIASGLKRKDLLFHGITPETGGWRPFAKVEEFDACIAAIREREKAGKLKVVSYDEFLGSRPASSPLCEAHGRISDAERYAGLHPRLGKVFAWLRETDLMTLAPGRHAIEGDDIYANVMDEAPLAPYSTDALLEAHRRYIDVQVPLSGPETYGYVYDDRAKTSPDFDVEKDYILFKNPAMKSITVKPGEFIIFFPPGGAHAPNKTTDGRRKFRKLVVKVRND